MSRVRMLDLEKLLTKSERLELHLIRRAFNMRVPAVVDFRQFTPRGALLHWAKHHGQKPEAARQLADRAEALSRDLLYFLGVKDD
jgi:hypothetical protein